MNPHEYKILYDATATEIRVLNETVGRLRESIAKRCKEVETLQEHLRKVANDRDTALRELAAERLNVRSLNDALTYERAIAAKSQNSPVMFVAEHDAKIKYMVKASDVRMKHAETYYGDRLDGMGQSLVMIRSSIEHVRTEAEEGHRMLLARIVELERRMGPSYGKGQG